jgi:hypothetical protein
MSLYRLITREHIAFKQGEIARNRLQNQVAAMPERISARNPSINLRPLLVSACRKVQPSRRLGEAVIRNAT